MVTIGLDKELDKVVFKDFWGFSAEGADFSERGIRRVHPTITEETFSQYIDTYYADHMEEMLASCHELQKELDTTSGEFFSAVTGLFGSDYSAKQYTGLLSIFDCNPRFVDQKKFQVFCQRDVLGKLEVAYHETLHFIFFEHAANTCPDIAGPLDVNGGAYWALSEIFNVLVLNRSEFQKVLRREEQMFYPMLRPYVEPIRTIYEEHPDDFCCFIHDSLAYLEAEREKQT